MGSMAIMSRSPRVYRRPAQEMDDVIHLTWHWPNYAMGFPSPIPPPWMMRCTDNNVMLANQKQEKKEICSNKWRGLLAERSPTSSLQTSFQLWLKPAVWRNAGWWFSFMIQSVTVDPAAAGTDLLLQPDGWCTGTGKIVWVSLPRLLSRSKLWERQVGDAFVTVETRAQILHLIGRSSVFNDPAFHSIFLWIPQLQRLCVRPEENMQFIFNLRPNTGENGGWERQLAV